MFAENCWFNELKQLFFKRLEFHAQKIAEFFTAMSFKIGK